MLVAHLITLPSTLFAMRFEEFARTKYLPALHEGPTRVGQVLSAKILRRIRMHTGDAEDLDRSFLLLVEFVGVEARLPRVEPAVQGVFDAFDPQITELGAFEEVASRALKD